MIFSSWKSFLAGKAGMEGGRAGAPRLHKWVIPAPARSPRRRCKANVGWAQWKLQACGLWVRIQGCIPGPPGIRPGFGLAAPLSRTGTANNRLASPGAAGWPRSARWESRTGFPRNLPSAARRESAGRNSESVATRLCGQMHSRKKELNSEPFCGRSIGAPGEPLVRRRSLLCAPTRMRLLFHVWRAYGRRTTGVWFQKGKSFLPEAESRGASVCHFPGGGGLNPLVICQLFVAIWRVHAKWSPRHRMEMITIFQDHCSCSGNYSFALKLPSKARRLSYGAET